MQILLWLLGSFRKLLHALLGLIRDYPWQAITFGLVLAVLLVFRQWAIDHRDLTDQLADANGTIAEERSAHADTIENVRRGQEAARELDRRNVERVAVEELAIKERTIRDLQNRNRVAAAGADRLRAQVAALAVSAGGGGTAAVPGNPDATCRAFGAADCDELAARMIDAQASIDKLIALQAWSTGVAGIEVNGE